MHIHLDKLALIVIVMALTLQWTPAFLLFPWQHWGLVILPIFLIAFGYRHLSRRLSSIFFYVSFALGCLAYFQHSALQDYLAAKAIEPQQVRIEIRIDEILQQQAYQTLIVSTKNSQRIYLQWRLNEKPKIGERWQADLRIRPLSSRLNQGGFDRQKWYFSKGIHATATVKSAVKISDDFSWRERQLHQAFAQTKALAQQGLLLALGFGERAWLNPETWSIYQKTNTAHLIAISGLHIGLAMFLGFGIARVIQFVFPLKWITPLFPILVGIALAVVYTELAGFAIPTFRAIVSLLLITLVKLQRGYYTPWQLFVFVIAVLLICDPIMVLSASFWLSVGAVASLILWYQVFPFHLIQWQGQPLPIKVRWILGLIHLQLGLFWLFTPIQLMIFDGFAFNGLIANLIAVPLYSFLLVPVTLFAALTHGVAYSWQIADFLAGQITAVVQLFQGSWIIFSESQILIFIAFLALIFVTLMNWTYGKIASKSQYHYFNLDPCRSFPIKSRKRINFIGFSIVIFCISMLLFHKITPKNWRVETLDVGQGLATLIVKNARGVLYDTGASWVNGSMAKSEIIPYLQRKGIELDWLILSHDDNDHSGGAQDILAYSQLKLLTPSNQNKDKTDRTFCVVGKTWQWEGLTFSVLSPDHITERAENADSCVILISDGQFNVLLTGDADIATEQRILANLPKIDVLQVGHHGSQTSTGSKFVQHIRPDISLISSSRWNPWHFPHKDVVARLENAGSAVKNTAVLGQISVIFDKTGMQIQSARSDFSPWYRGFIGEIAK